MARRGSPIITMNTPDDLRRHAPATLRNREPILDVLRGILPASGLVLELASGSGEHIAHFARQLPGLSWQPSDPSPQARQSIAAWIGEEDLSNVLPPVEINAEQDIWPVTSAAAILCINMIHISPWEATVGLMRGAGDILPQGGLLYLYGPYRRDDRPLEPGNAAFDLDLHTRDARWGLRRLEDVASCAALHGLTCIKVVDMPANNLSVIFRKE